MKSCGNIMRVIAIVAFIGLLGCAISNFAINIEEYEKDREDFDTQLVKHEAEIVEEESYGMTHDKEYCSICEREKTLDQRKIVLISTFIQNVLLYLLFSGILYAVGEIAFAKVIAQPKNPVEPVSVSCPQCGSAMGHGSRFCVVCGAEKKQ